MPLTLTQAVHLAGLPQPAARAFLQRCAMTLQDQERHAYVSGQPVEAELLSLAIDAETLDDERAAREDAQRERDSAVKEADRLEQELDAQAEVVEKLEQENHGLTARVNELLDQIFESGVDLV